jgi:hypothetical protein
MITLLQRFRPSRTTFAALAGLAWALSFGAVRDFVWADLREGMMSTHGLSRAMRVLVWSGFALLGAMIGALLFNDLWRVLSPLIALEHVSASNAGRGALLPVAVIPATLFLIALSWSFMLAGVLHSHPALRVVALLLYVPFALVWVGAGASDLAGSAGATLAALVAVLAVPLFFAVRWRAVERPEFEFAILLALVTAACAIGQARALALWRSTEMPLALAVVELSVAQLKGLVMPMLFLLGLDIAAFTRQGAGWATRFVAERLPGWGLWLALLGELFLELLWITFAGFDRQRPEALRERGRHRAAQRVSADMLAHMGGLVGHARGEERVQRGLDIGERPVDRGDERGAGFFGHGCLLCAAACDTGARGVPGEGSPRRHEDTKF